MAAKNKRKKLKEREGDEGRRLHPETKKSIWGLVLVGAALVLTLAYFHKAGPVGDIIYTALETLFGWGYFALPLALLLVAGVFFVSERQKVVSVALFGAALFVFSALGLIDIAFPGRGGWLGFPLGGLRMLFGQVAAAVIDGIALLAAFLIIVNAPIKIRRTKKETPAAPATAVAPVVEERPAAEPEVAVAEARPASHSFLKPKRPSAPPTFKNYVPPPLDLLTSSIEKPTTGDLRANANIIKRTLDGFGIPVEMGEVNVGPKVTRYTLKPAEGMKLSRITALSQDLALALAAHPIRIEAPIPGKSLVGIEVPNRAAAVVRLGSLMAYPEFAASGLLGFALGRDVTGEPVFADIERMPHLLVAGATGSGKSVAIHSLLVSLLYKNSPATLKLILIDPKRVELTAYEHLPHLVAPVITESKKAAGVFRWAISEMERRYELLQYSGSRDIKGYNVNGGKDDPLPYLLVVVDELADIMTAYGREVEGSVVRLAQMARATGIHLILSTQRPSVEVITGLIKANITNRLALQVASQVDSRTILDTAGAEKLLGGGDLLFVSSDLSKPKRIQGAYLPEEEIHKVTDFIREHNADVPAAEEEFLGGTLAATALSHNVFDDSLEGEGDELYDEAVTVVADAKKASASLLQRRLKVGYARAARLLDLMEERGVVGPGEGAKPREVYLPDRNEA